MKILRVFGPAILLPIICLVVSGCATTSKTVDTTPRFHEGASVSVVLEFNRWEHLFIKRPDFRENGYLRPLRREDLAGAFNSLRVNRDTAVVLLGWNYGHQQTAQIVEEWKSILRSQGFHRVVCLRADDRDELDGKVIINDWKQSDDKPKQTAQL